MSLGMFLQDLSALSSIECCELGCVSTQKQIEWSKMNGDSEAAVTTSPLSFGPEGNGYGQTEVEVRAILMPRFE